VAANFINQPGASIPNACGDGAGLLICRQHSGELDRKVGGRLWQTPEDLTLLTE
jgi:hypothetical protein